MSALSPRARLRAAAAVATDAFGWWTGELAAMLPRRLHGDADRQLLVQPAPQGLEILRETEAGPVPVADLQADRQTGRERTLATLRLPPEMVLARTVVLAAAAEENLLEVVGFQLDRYTPFDLEEVHLGCRVIGRDGDAESITVAFAVAQRSDVAALSELARTKGVRCSRVVAAAEAFEGGLGEDLAFDAEAGGTQAGPGGGRAIRWLAMVALLLLVADIATPLLRGHSRLAALRREEVALRREATAVASLREAVEQAAERAAIPLQRWQRAPLSTLLTEVTHLVPDSGWVTQMEIDPGSIQLTGYAASANGLIPVLEQSKLFTNATFRSPVTQDPAHGVEQFHLSLDLRRRNE